jgi:hypothetical protein
MTSGADEENPALLLSRKIGQISHNAVKSSTSIFQANQDNQRLEPELIEHFRRQRKTYFPLEPFPSPASTSK